MTVLWYHQPQKFVLMPRQGEQIAQGKEKTLPTSFGLGALQEFGDVKVGLYRYDGYEPPERIDVQG